VGVCAPALLMLDASGLDQPIVWISSWSSPHRCPTCLGQVFRHIVVLKFGTAGYREDCRAKVKSFDSMVPESTFASDHGGSQR